MTLYHFPVLAASALLLVSALWNAVYHWLKRTGRRTGPSPLYYTFFFIAVSIFLVRCYINYQSMPRLEAVLISILDILHYFTMGTEFEMEILRLPAPWPALYNAVNATLCVVAPICTITFIFSLFGGILRKFLLTLRFLRPIYYFSQLNEKSFTLADSIYRGWRDLPLHRRLFRKPYLIFCQVDLGNADNTELQFRTEAEQLGAIFYDDPIHVVPLHIRFRRQAGIFLIHTDEESNVLALLKMREKLYRSMDVTKEDPKGQKDLFVFSTLDSSAMLFDKILWDEKARYAPVKKAWKAAPAAPLRTQRLIFDLHLINETQVIAQELLFQYPLFQTVRHEDRNPRISMLIIGGGQMGVEILKTAMNCGVTNQYAFDVRVIDKQAQRLRQQFAHKYPYLEAHQSLGQRTEAMADAPAPTVAVYPTFHTADVTQKSFDLVMGKHCRDCNYIVIATGDDEQNIQTAQYLARWYARYDIETKTAAPRLIFAAIRNSERYEALHRFEDRHSVIHYFGCNTDIFSVDTILHRRLDTVSTLYHTLYAKVDFTTLIAPIPEPRRSLFSLRPAENPFHLEDRRRREFRRDFYLESLENQRSNQMVALHSLYKFQDLLHAEGCSNALMAHRADPTDTARLFRQLVQLTVSDKNWQSLLRLEHRRWNVAKVLEGWEPYPLDLLTRLEGREAYPDNKNLPGHLHACIVPFDQLGPLSDTINQLRKEKYDAYVKEVAAYNKRLAAGQATPEPTGLSTFDPEDYPRYDAIMCCVSLFAWLYLEGSVKETLEVRKQLVDKVLASGEPSGEFTADDFRKLLQEVYAEKTLQTIS